MHLLHLYSSFSLAYRYCPSIAGVFRGKGREDKHFVNFTAGWCSRKGSGLCLKELHCENMLPALRYLYYSCTFSSDTKYLYMFAAILLSEYLRLFWAHENCTTVQRSVFLC